MPSPWLLRTGAMSVLLDCMREVRPPFSPETVTLEVQLLLQIVSHLGGCRVIAMRVNGRANVSGSAASPMPCPRRSAPILYRDLLPLLNSRRVDSSTTRGSCHQLTSLERRTARSGRDTIDHPPREHDDLSNAVAGALPAAQKQATVAACEWGFSPRPTRAPGSRADTKLTP